MGPESTVHIVDDDQAVRSSLLLLMRSAGHKAAAFESAQAFLESGAAYDPGCLILDVRMPGMSGLELQEYLMARGLCIPVIILTGHGDVPMAVRALKAGAVDFIEKPFKNQALLERVEHGLRLDRQRRREERRSIEISRRLARLTPREKEVMQGLVDGKTNKAIAAELGISTRTVEAHRARTMEKLQVRSLSEIVRLALGD